MNVLVVGDTILDRYIFGNIERVNPEAAYSLVLDYEYSKVTLGGAANVAANIRSLVGSEHNIYYLGYISPETSELLSKNKVKYLASKFIKDEDMLLKTRFVYDNHIILRLDTNKDFRSLVKTQYAEDLIFRLENNNLFYDLDLIIISDYAKKTLSQDLLNKLFTKYSNTIFMFDIKKPINNTFLPENCIFKCNQKEWNVLQDIGYRPNKGWFVRTEGKYGYSLSHNIDNENSWINYPAINVGEIIDTVGCGDTFIAGMAADCIRSGKFTPEDHADYGNKCSAVKVKKFGTTTITKEDVDSL